ncbi:aldo/keto reductase [Bifidobacterium cuniculi]|uniref:Aldo/keto reductase n=1 Tax=Bifidobacterium cuniculi TaxID=1688 RepID=A0A087ATJ2_9BIFI|nr:aldo/keto reductase [Bifidobacterium cuniculi]KFI62092.1 aldo/keto reductase [Bifidobacterium cuniculi]
MKYPMLSETYTLNNGVEIPRLGLGTWLIPDNKAADAVTSAIDLGYRMIDTAQAYGNEAGVGEGVRSSGIARDQLFVTTKIDASHKSYDSAAQSIDESLQLAKFDYFDMIIIHCPQPWDQFRGEDRYFEQNVEVWRALEDAYQAGKVRAIGVSNFLADDLQNILDHATVKPAVNQVLCHAGNVPFGLIDTCRQADVLVEAYSPVAHGAALGNGLLVELAEKYGVSVAQLCIRYVLQLGCVALPKTANPQHMAQNADVAGFEISHEDMERIKRMPDLDQYGEDGFFPVFAKSDSAR